MDGSRPKSAPQRSREVSGSRVPTPALDPRGYAPPFFKVERGKWKLHSDLTYKVSYWQGAVTTTYGLSYVDPQELVASLKSNPPEGATANGSKADALKQFAELKRSLRERRAAKNEISQHTEEQAGDGTSAGIELAVEGGAAPGTPTLVNFPENDFRCSTPRQRPKSAVARPDTASTTSTFAPPSTPGRPQSARIGTPASLNRPQSAASSAQSDWACQKFIPFGGQRLQPTMPSGFAFQSPRRSHQQKSREAVAKDDVGRFGYTWPL